MSLSVPQERFLDQLRQQISTGGTPPCPPPLSISPWLAMSLLQKAIRRSDTASALDAASTLLATSPDRLWRRAGIIAFEDVGLADLTTVGIVTVALTGKRLRQSLGGEWAVAATIIARMSANRKNRAADDLLCVLDSWPNLTEQKARLADIPQSRLQLIARTTEQLPLRALALRLIFADRHLNLRRHGDAETGFRVLDELGVAPTTLAIAKEGYRRTGSYLAPLIALLSCENDIRGAEADDPLPPTCQIGPLPSWALDMFTREGRKALAKVLDIDAGIRQWSCEARPVAGRLELLAQALFRVESGLCLHRSDGVTSKKLRGQMERECMGIRPEEADTLLGLMQNALPLLNQVRCEVMKEHTHA